MARKHEIKIRNKGRIHDNDCRKTLSKSGNDEVEWRAVAGGNWTILFAQSPFAADRFVVSGTNSVPSGPPIKGTPDEKYKYAVIDNTTGEEADDPDILIET